MEIDKNKKLGLVLEGGGARGAYQAGALKAFFEEGYKFDAVVGTSIGALNGVMVAQNKFEDAYKVWNDIDFATVLNIKNEYGENVALGNYNRETFRYFYSYLKTVIAEKGVDTTKIQKLLDDNIDENILRNSGIDFGVMAYSLTEKKPVPIFVDEMREGTVAKYVMASATFPVFKSTMVDDQSFIDGGVYDNMPVNMLIDRGYKDIVAIETKSSIPKRKVKDKSVQIHYIRPSLKPGRVMDFTASSTDQSVLIGYYDVLKILRGYIGSYYYIDAHEKSPFGYGLCDFDKTLYEEIANIMQVKYFNQNILNGIICREFRLRTKNIADTLLQIFENVAKSAKLERYKIYTLDDFIKQTANKADEIKNIGKILQKEIAIVKLVGKQF